MTAALPESFRPGWRVVGTRTDRDTVAFVTITAETTVFEHRKTAEILEVTTSDLAVRSLLAVDLAFSPPLSILGAGPERLRSLVTSNATDRFVERLEDAGVAVLGERKTVEFDRGDGTAGNWYVFETAHPIALSPDDGAKRGDESTATAMDGQDHTRLATETHVAVWPTDASFAMAGGTLPLERPPKKGTSSDTTIEVDPERDRETIATFVRARAADTLDVEDEATRDRA
ncbi:hypothetical protein [Natronosalvus vescus]|uniref:hypothetical protein n=1 Tax=Natronosalvus vescus TaxID=2953881 RepID=UPI002090C9C5|nr:hypothetical protein [Natronosalvus vescus]